MKVNPVKTIRFQESISIFEASVNHEQFILENKTNRHYILDKDFGIKCQFETTYEHSELSAIHPNEPYIAIMGKDNILHIVDFNGVDIWSKPGEYIAACWTLDGAALYTLLRLDPNTLKLIVYNNDGKTVAEKEFKDELYESSALFSTIPNQAEMTLQLMAGQDGCLTIFTSLKEGKGISFTPLHDCFSYTCVAFNGDGSRFLCIENDEQSIHHFTYPELEEIGKYQFDFNLYDCNLEYTVIYLDNKAIVQYGENFYLLDIKTMKIAEDFIIAGHEPVPVYEIYKRLVDDKNLICDVSYLCGAGKHILGCTNRDGINDIIVLDKPMAQTKDQHQNTGGLHGMFAYNYSV